MPNGSLIQLRQNSLVVMYLHLEVVQRSVRQTIIARSTMESKFVVLKMVGSEAEWLKNFLENIPLGMKPTPFVSMRCDC